jgi:hypothetical protein
MAKRAVAWLIDLTSNVFYHTFALWRPGLPID